jgi:hypothetical protein
MQFTPEQLSQIQQAKANDERRVLLQFTTEQRMEWQNAVEQEFDDKHGNIPHFHKVQSAAEQPGFFGDIRRAILLSRRPMNELATTIGVEPRVLSDFRAAEAVLSPVELDRLVTALDLRLMQEIPR